MTKTPFNWKLFFILVAACILGLVAIVPYSLALQNQAALADLEARAGIPLWMVVALQLAPQAVLFAFAIWVGLSFAGSVGLGLPLLEARLRGQKIGDALRSILPISILLGVVLGLLIIALEIFVFQPALSSQAAGTALAGQSTVRGAAWKGFLASFYGGINEEVLLRLCVMSFLVWLGRFISKTPEGKPTSGVIWVANILAAVLFGLGHLPATAAILPLTPLVVTRAIVLNGLAGVGFGYLYSKHGLESAMISHFSADIILHVLFAL